MEPRANVSPSTQNLFYGTSVPPGGPSGRLHLDVWAGLQNERSGEAEALAGGAGEEGARPL